MNFTCRVTFETYISTLSYFFLFEGCRQHANLTFEKLENDIGRGMTSPSLDYKHGPMTSGVA
ncbi:MAG: hypothetical protein II200_09155 [Bacteroidaceae bacterium]|nr:hypothetical protein [Bacteroidaceae bacterium]